MLGDQILANLPRLRAEAESLMVDEATIERKDGSKVRDPGNGQMIPGWRRVLSTPVRVVRVTTQDRESETGGQLLNQTRVEFRAPWSLSDLRVGDRITVTTARDPRLEGVPLTVVEVGHATHAVARRFVGVLDEDRRV